MRVHGVGLSAGMGGSPWYTRREVKAALRLLDTDLTKANLGEQALRLVEARVDLCAALATLSERDRALLVDVAYGYSQREAFEMDAMDPDRCYADPEQAAWDAYFDALRRLCRAINDNTTGEQRLVAAVFAGVRQEER